MPDSSPADTGFELAAAESGGKGEAGKRVGTEVRLPRKPLGGFVARGLLRTLRVTYFDGLRDQRRMASVFKEKLFHIVLLTCPFCYWNALLNMHFEERRWLSVSRRMFASASPLLGSPVARTKEVFPGKLHLSLMTVMCPSPVSEVEKQ